MATPGKKTVSKKALLNWETELREDYDFIYDESGEKVIQAFCRVCRSNYDKVSAKFKGKVERIEIRCLDE